MVNYFAIDIIIQKINKSMLKSDNFQVKVGLNTPMKMLYFNEKFELTFWPHKQAFDL